MRTAASNWEKEYSKTLEEVGFQPGRATVVAFFHPERDIRIIVHGDDFVVEGEQSDLEWVRDVLAAKYLLKVRGILGPEPCDLKSIVILGRAVEWRADELWWEADPRHVEKILEVCGMTFRKTISLARCEIVGGGRRRSTTRGRRVGQVQVCCSDGELHRSRSPRCEVRGERRKMKKLARYFKGQPRVVQKIKFDVDGIGTEVNVIVGSDWAGCASTRKSTTFGCIMVGDICVKAWSTTQKVVALSSGEAEYCAAVNRSQRGPRFLGRLR